MTQGLMFSNLALTSLGVGLISAGVALVVAVPFGMFLSNVIAKSNLSKRENRARNIIQDAINEAKTVKKEAVLEAKDEVFKLKSEADAELKERRAEITKSENRIIQREEFLNKKELLLDNKIEALERAKLDLSTKEETINQKIKEQDTITNKMLAELERISGLTKEEAKKVIIDEYVEEAKKDAANLVREIEQEAKEEANKKAKDIITLAIQKCATDHTSEVTVSSVVLPSDEMKGRIIGREGRNIRALESATGVDLIIYYPPEAVLLSSFDPIRIEIQKISL